jgi:hypothetical protein
MNKHKNYWSAMGIEPNTKEKGITIFTDEFVTEITRVLDNLYLTKEMLKNEFKYNR